jgi:hypothetical protein
MEIDGVDYRPLAESQDPFDHLKLNLHQFFNHVRRNVGPSLSRTSPFFSLRFPVFVSRFIFRTFEVKFFSDGITYTDRFLVCLGV